MVLQGGYQHSEQPASAFLKLAAQEALEQEVTDFLGRDRYERQEEPVEYRTGSDAQRGGQDRVGRAASP